MKALDFTLSMSIQKFMKPLERAQAGLKELSAQSQASFTTIGMGAAGLWGAAKSIQSFIDPAIQMVDAINATATRNIDDNTLKKLTNDALEFSSAFGSSATDFVHSAAVVKTSLQGISNQELPRATIAVNSLALATGNTADQTAAYMGTIYAQYKNTADRMGKVKFLDQLAGQTAYMTANFGMDTQKLQGLLLSSKGAGSQFGASMNEQFAVLGQLEKSLGSAAGSGYEAFLKNAASGGEALGISLVDANNQLLSMPQMLEKLQSKYGSSIKGNIAAQKELERAFGGKGAVAIRTLWENTAELDKHMNGLAKNGGLDHAQKMALQLGNVWQTLSAIWQNIRIAIGMALLPMLEPMIEKFTSMGQTFQRWMVLFPGVAKLIGIIVLAIGGFAATMAMLNIIMGISKLIAMSYNMSLGLIINTKSILAIKTALCSVGLKAWNVGVKLANLAVIGYNVAIAALSNAKNAAMLKTIAFYMKLIVFKTLMIGLKVVLLIAKVAMFAFGVAVNFATWPILLIVAAVALLATGIYLLIKNWDRIIASIKESGPFQSLMQILEAVSNMFSYVIDAIKTSWDSFTSYLTNTSLLDMFKDLGKAIMGVFSSIWRSIKSTFANIYNNIVEKLNMIPGVNIALIEVAEVAEMPEIPEVPEIPEIPQMPQVVGVPEISSISQAPEVHKALQVPIIPETETKPIETESIIKSTQIASTNPGGIQRELSNSQTTSTDNSRSIGTVNVYPKEVMSSNQMLELQELYAF